MFLGSTVYEDDHSNILLGVGILKIPGGAWVPQSVKPPPRDFGSSRDLRVIRSSSVLSPALSKESTSLSLSQLFPLPVDMQVSLSIK